MTGPWKKKYKEKMNQEPESWCNRTKIKTDPHINNNKITKELTEGQSFLCGTRILVLDDTVSEWSVKRLMVANKFLFSFLFV